MDSSATFRLTANEFAGAVDRLTRLGFDRGPSQAATVSLLDTFGGGLRRAGLQVELRDRDGLEVILFDGRSASALPTAVSVTSVPQRASELPRGPLRDRITDVVGARPLRSRVQLAAASTCAVARNRTGAVTAMAMAYQELRVSGGGSIDEASVVIEIRGVDGHRKRAGSAIDALEHLGLRRVDGGSFTSVIAAIGADRAVTPGNASVPLDPAMPAVDGFRAVLDNLAATVEANWQGVIDRSDPECLHQLRIAVRRSRSVLAQARDVLPTPLFDYGDEHLGWLGSVTSAARNLDVYLINWDDYTEGLDGASIAALDPVHALLEQRCAQAYVTLAADLRAADQAELIARWRARLREPIAKAARGRHSQRRLARVVTKRIARAQAKLLQEGRAINAESPPEALHALRKDAKKVRYLLECFGTIMPKRRHRAFGKRLKGLQTNLGEYQDTNILIDELVSVAVEAHESGVAPDTMLAVGRLIERLDQHRLDARHEFEARFAAYDSQSTRLALRELLDRTRR